MAISLYEAAHGFESELPYYQLNLAAAHLKLNKYVIPHLLLPIYALMPTSSWMKAEEACTKVLKQHRNVKGLYRRGKARRMLGRNQEAIQGTPRPVVYLDNSY